MENKKLGLLLIVIAILVGGMFLYYNNTLSEQSRELNCFNGPSCISIQKNFSVSHIGVGILAFILALGFYLLFFDKAEKRIRQIEKENDKRTADNKFDLILQFLNPSESKVLKKVKEEEGITQSTLKFRLDMSKARLSYILQDLEKRKIIKRVKKGKSQAIYLKI